MKKRIIIIICVAILLLFVIVKLLVDNFVVSTEKLSIDIDNYSGNAKIALLSDLHNREYGKNNSQIIDILENEKPNIICCVGDMFDESTESDDSIVELFSKISFIAPTYYSLGNHEYFFQDTKLKERYLNDITNMGTTILNNEYVDINLGGDQVRLGGIYDYMNMLNLTEKDGQGIPMYDFFMDYWNTNNAKILMCHMPEGFVCYNHIFDWKTDLELCGHTHGGIVEFPIFDRGLYVPYQGWFAKYYDGYYKLNNEDVVITSGLDVYKKAPRFMNQVEIKLINIS